MCIEITKRLAGGPVTITDLGVAANLNFAKTREVLGVLLKSGIVDFVSAIVCIGLGYLILVFLDHLKTARQSADAQ